MAVPRSEWQRLVLRATLAVCAAENKTHHFD